MWAAIHTAKPTSADADDPGEHALADGADAAHAEAAVLRGVLERPEVGDHVALLLGGQVAVGEVRHVLRAGQHRLVDVPGLDAADLRGVATLRHGATGAVEVVAGGAVGQEDLAAADDRLLALLVGQPLEAVVGLVGDGRAGAERGDVRRERGDLLLVVRRRSCAGPGLRAGPSASGRCRPGSRRRRRRRRPATGRSWLPLIGADALAVLSVAERAADQEELTTLGDLLGVGLLLLGLRGRQDGVQGAGQHEPEEQQHQAGERATTVPREPTCGAVQEAHIESLVVPGGGSYWMR